MWLHINTFQGKLCLQLSCTYIHNIIYAYMYVRIYNIIHKCICTCSKINMYMYINHIHVYTCIYKVYTYMYMYIHVRIYMYVCNTAVLLPEYWEDVGEVCVGWSWSHLWRRDVLWQSQRVPLTECGSWNSSWNTPKWTALSCQQRKKHNYMCIYVHIYTVYTCTCTYITTCTCTVHVP